MTPVNTMAGVGETPKFIDFQQAGGAAGKQNQPLGGATFSFKLPEPPQHITEVQKAGETGASAITEPTSWGQMLQRIAMDVNSSQQTAADKVRDVIAGGETPVHEAMISMQEASVRFTMLSELRNKMIEAYQEIMRMQV